MLGQRMARQVEAQHFLLGRQPLALVPFGHVGQTGVVPVAGSSSSSSNSPFWPLRRSAKAEAPDCNARSSTADPLRAPCRRSESKAPALTSDSIGRAVDARRVEPLAEVEQAAEWAAGLALGDDRLGRLRRRSP